MRQIWNDTDFTLSGQERPVRITVDGKEIFRGVLNAYPNEEAVNMLINKICEPFLEIDYPERTGVTSHPKAYRVFMVEDWSGNTLGSQDFIYDWSYETWRPVLSKPVNGKLDPRMRLPYTMWNSTDAEIVINVEKGSHWVDPDTCTSDCPLDYCADCYADYCASDFEPEPMSDVYVSEIQVPGNTVYSYGNPVFTMTSVSSALTCNISSSYYSVSQSGNNSRFNMVNTSVPAPTGNTGNIVIMRNGDEFADIDYRVTSLNKNEPFMFDSGNSIPVEEMTFRFADSPGGVDSVRVNPDSGNNFGFSGFTLHDYYNIVVTHLRTIIADGAYLSFNPECYFDMRNNQNGVLTFRKSAKTNAIYLYTNPDYNKTTYSVELASGYCAIMVYQQWVDKGLTDIYLDNTKWWFNSLPDLDGLGDEYLVKRGKFYAGRTPITVHCKDGDVTWIPNQNP